MGTYKFIKDYVSPNAKDTQAKQKDTKYRPTDQQTLQAIVDILFDGNVDEHSNITINGLREDFSGKCHFTVINDCVLINYIDIFHAVYKPVNGENTRRAMGKFIEHFKQLKDKYTIKAVSRSDDSSKYGIGIEPTLIVTGFTEEELTILRANAKVVKPITNFGYNNHKFALIEKDAKPDSTYIIFDNIEIMLNYKYRIQEQYGIESEVYHIDTNDFDLDKVKIYGKQYEGYYFTSESLPMKKVEFKPFDGYSTKFIGDDIVIVSGIYLSDDIDYYDDIDNFIKNHGDSSVNGFTPTSIDISYSGGCDYILAYRKPLNNQSKLIPFILYQEFINSSETIKRVIDNDIVIYCSDLKSEFLEFIKTYDNPKNLYGLTEEINKVKQYIEDGIIGEGYLGCYIEKMYGYVCNDGSKLYYTYSKVDDKRVIYSKDANSIGIISTPFRIIKDGQDLVHGEIIEPNTDFDENETVGVFINSLIDYNVLIDKHANYHYASIACSEKIATAIVDEGDYSDFSIWNEKGLSTYRGNVFGVCEFGQDSETSFSHQVKFYTIKELLEKGCVVSRLNKNTYAVSGFTDLDDSLIKEYQITRL
jgi:hypothetical protein|nr:MAG TPA: hypothetical protein [Caudoviricetes sp.]